MKSPRPVRRLRLVGAIAFTALASFLALEARGPLRENPACAPGEARAALWFSLEPAAPVCAAGPAAAQNV